MLRVDAKESQSGRHLFRKRKGGDNVIESRESNKKPARLSDEKVRASSVMGTNEKLKMKTLLSFDHEEEG